jgi:hypothetical protein
MTDLFATSRCPWGLPEGQVNQPERRAPIARNDRSIVHFTGNIFRLIDDPVDSWTVDTLCSLSELLEDLLHKRFTWLSVWVPADLLCPSDKGVREKVEARAPIRSSDLSKRSDELATFGSVTERRGGAS